MLTDTATAHADPLTRRVAHYAAMPAPAAPADAQLSARKHSSGWVLEAAREQYRLNPYDLRAADWLAYLLYADERYTEALPLLQLLVRLPGASGLHHLYLANAYAALGSRDRAVDHWELAARQDADPHAARSAQARLKHLALTLARR